MDNTAFENNMINAVNGNAKAADTERASKFIEDARKYVERRKAQRLRAIGEFACWFFAYSVIVCALGALCWFGKFPSELAIAISSVLGLITGWRIRGLANMI